MIVIPCKRVEELSEERKQELSINLIVCSWLQRANRANRRVNVEIDAKKNVRELIDRLDEELKNIDY
jgi:biotin-(acetyl-CoA carboxylase) ligase